MQHFRLESCFDLKKIDNKKKLGNIYWFLTICWLFVHHFQMFHIHEMKLESSSVVFFLKTTIWLMLNIS